MPEGIIARPVDGKRVVHGMQPQGYGPSAIRRSCFRLPITCRVVTMLIQYINTLDNYTPNHKRKCKTLMQQCIETCNAKFRSRLVSILLRISTFLTENLESLSLSLDVKKRDLKN